MKNTNITQYFWEDEWIKDLLVNNSLKEERIEALNNKIDLFIKTKEYKEYKELLTLYVTRIFNAAEQYNNNNADERGMFLYRLKSDLNSVKRNKDFLTKDLLFRFYDDYENNGSIVKNIWKNTFNLNENLTEDELLSFSIIPENYSHYEKSALVFFNKLLSFFTDEEVKEFNIKRTSIVAPMGVYIKNREFLFVENVSIGTKVKLSILQNKFNYFENFTQEQKTKIIKNLTYKELMNVYHIVSYENGSYRNFLENLVNEKLFDKNAKEKVTKKIFKDFYVNDIKYFIKRKAKSVIQESIDNNNKEDYDFYKKLCEKLEIDYILDIKYIFNNFTINKEENSISYDFLNKSSNYTYTIDKLCDMAANNSDIKFSLKEDAKSSWSDVIYKSLKLTVKKNIDINDFHQIILNVSEEIYKKGRIGAIDLNMLNNKLREHELNKLIENNEKKNILKKNKL